MEWLLAWMSALSLLAFILCVADKQAARSGRRRVRERTLLLIAVAGGAVGLLLAMILASHKTRKAAFLVVVPLAAVVQVAGVVWVGVG